MTENAPKVIALTPEWLVLDKPPGWLTIPAHEGQGPVLLDWARERHGELWTVHRIDRGTTGVVLLARTRDAHREANGWFAERKVRKSYDLLAVGRAPAPVMRVNRPIEGFRAVTQVEVRESYEEGFLARATPLTGKRHQIRIHLSEEGCPLWGDPLHGGPTRIELGQKTLEVRRPALHAARLELPTKEAFEAPWPADFDEWVQRLRAEGRPLEGTHARPAH